MFKRKTSNKNAIELIILDYFIIVMYFVVSLAILIIAIVGCFEGAIFSGFKSILFWILGIEPSYFILYLIFRIIIGLFINIDKISINTNRNNIEENSYERKNINTINKEEKIVCKVNDSKKENKLSKEEIDLKIEDLKKLMEKELISEEEFNKAVRALYEEVL